MNQHKAIVQELLASGLTQKQLGAMIGKSQAWVGAVLAEKFSDIKWTEGEALRKLRAERVQKVDSGETAPPVDEFQEVA